MGQQQGAGAPPKMTGTQSFGDWVGMDPAARGNMMERWNADRANVASWNQAMMQRMMAQDQGAVGGGAGNPPTPQQVPPPGATPQGPPPEQIAAPDPSGRTGSLGLGLGLNARQRARFQAAAQAGQGAQYLGEHQQLANRVQNRIQAGSPAETRLQNFIATGQSQRPYAQNPNRLMRR